jgi:hypothetical protein
MGRPFAPRYVVMAAPAGAALVALATRRLPGPILGLSLSVFVIASSVVLAPYYGGFVRSDYGRAMDALRERVRGSDAIVLNGPWQDFLYRRYGGGLPPHYFMTSQVPTTAQEAVPRLEQLAATHPRIWVVDAATDLTDPQGVVAGWMDAHAYPGPVLAYQKALLRPYLTDATGVPPSSHPLEITALDLRITEIALDRWTIDAGDEIRMLVRTDSATDGGPRRMLARLVDGRGETIWHWDGRLEPSGAGLRFGASLMVPSNVQPGDAALEAILYEPEHAEGPPSVRRIAPPVTLGTVEIRG